MIQCLECGKRFKGLVSHINRIHNLNKKQYLQKYPHGSLVSEELRQKYLGENNHFFGKFHSEETKKKIPSLCRF